MGDSDSDFVPDSNADTHTHTNRGPIVLLTDIGANNPLNLLTQTTLSAQLDCTMVPPHRRRG